MLIENPVSSITTSTISASSVKKDGLSLANDASARNGHRSIDVRINLSDIYRVYWRSLSLVLIILSSGCETHDDRPDHARVVAIGDIHADIDAARKAFRLAGAIDAEDQWIGGNLIVVQLGDLIGRSYDEREVLEFALTVRERADAAGGAVHFLIGNHEVFGAELELRWVAEKAYAGFEGLPNNQLESPRFTDLPPYKLARSAALAPGGYYGSKIAEFRAVLRLDETIYVHGGVTPIWAKYGVDRINDELSRWFAGEIDQPAPALGRDARNVDDNVMMSRHFSEEVGIEECAMLDESLRILGAKRMIVAHTVLDSISSYCNGRVWAIDVGMSRYYGGNVEVLEIIDDEFITILRQ